MTVAYRASASVTVGTAGTAVIVPRPSGTAAGDLLVAFVAYTNTPTVTQPAGWIFLGTQTASTSVRMLAYYRVADGTEPTSWTWTIASSQRAWGWVGAYTGVDTSDPIIDWAGTADTTAGTDFSASNTADITVGAVGVGAVAAVRTASGSATTWLASGTERADVSTNGGSGTDIAGAVTETVYVGADPTLYGPSWTASQSQTAGAMLAVTLRPAFVGFDGGIPEFVVEVAWGADPDGDPDDWVWTDISADVKANPGITITKGLQPDSRAAVAPPTNVTLTVLNPTGNYTPDNPLGANWPNVVADTPLRVSVPYGYAPPTERAVVFVESWTPAWDTSTLDAVCQVQAYGRLQRVQAVNAPVESALRRALGGILPGSGDVAAAYWPCEDGSGARWAASASGDRPTLVTGAWSPASASDLPGSAPLPTLSTGARIQGYVRPYAATGQWIALAVLKLPETPVASTSPLLRATCTGTAPYWTVEITPGSPDTLHIRAHVDADTSLLDDSADIVEADVYGKWILLALVVTQNGSNVDYEMAYYTFDSGGGKSGTLNSRTIGVAREVRAEAVTSTDGIAVGHLGLIASATYDPINLGFLAFNALEGSVGDVPVFRFNELCQTRAIPAEFEHDIDLPALPMGPLTPTTLPAALEECAATSQGLIHDAGPGGALVMLDRTARYNNTDVLAVNVDARELAPPFAPTYSTRDRVSDSTVSRSGGSSARHVETDIRGARAEQISFSMQDDHFLAQVAGYRARLSSWRGMRYPQISINLRDQPGLLPGWLACRIGSRIRVASLWASHGPGEVDQHADGSTERITGDQWDVTLHCNPAAPFDVAVLEATDESAWRADCVSELASGIDDNDTSISVASTGALITTVGGNYPCDIDVGGEQITVTACSGASSPQTLTVTRGPYARAHDAGTQVRLWRGRGIAL